MSVEAARARRGTPLRSYRTDFSLVENPISEGGMWLNGRRDGIDWIDVVSAGGYAHGEVSRMTAAERRVEQGNLEPGDDPGAPTGDYDDPSAVLTGSWGCDQHARAVAFCRDPTEDYFQELQFRLRSQLAPHWCTGYEVFWRCLRGESSYAEIVRWNGKIGDWISLKRLVGPRYGVQDGDLLEASIFGNVITGFINGVEVISVTDDAFSEGAPGIGFNFYVGTTNVDHGFSSFEVDTWDPQADDRQSAR
jgi:hypothetical protein